MGINNALPSKSSFSSERKDTMKTRPRLRGHLTRALFQWFLMEFGSVLIVYVFDGVLTVFRASVVQFNHASRYASFGAISGSDMLHFLAQGFFRYVSICSQYVCTVKSEFVY